MAKLRDYQVKCIQELNNSIRSGNRRILVCVPTGGGKSTIFSHYTKICKSKGKRVLFMVHSKELVEQFAKRLSSQFSVSSGIIMSGVTPKRQKMVQVASVQTLVRRNKPEADLVIIDECHRSKARSYTKITEMYPNSIIVGLTATPFRTDGKSLGDLYDDIVHPVKIRELIAKGFLVPTKVVAPVQSIDFDSIKQTSKRFDLTDMTDKFSDGAVTRGVVDNYLARAKGKRTIVFNCNVAHSKEMNERFLQAGVKSAHIDGETPKADRAKIVKDFAAGRIDVLNSVDVFTEGFDIPSTEVVILNRATKSEGMYVQMVGRGLRPHEGKDHCLVLDHGGNTLRFGYVEDYDQRKFSLTEEKKPSKKAMKCKKCEVGIMKYNPTNKHFECDQCGWSYNTTKKRKRTFSDGSEFDVLDRDVVVVQRLIKMQNSKAKDRLPASQLRLYVLLRGYKRGWWFHTAIEKHFPDIQKDDPRAWAKVKYRLELAEIEGDIHRIYQDIKSQKNGATEAIQGEERETISA